MEYIIIHTYNKYFPEPLCHSSKIANNISNYQSMFVTLGMENQELYGYTMPFDGEKVYCEAVMQENGFKVLFNG